MKRKAIILSAVCLMSLFMHNKANAMGLFYTNANYPVTATGVTSPNDLSSLKQGKASALNVLAFVELGDAGVYKASKESNIKKINFIDVNEKTVFIFFRRITTTVYGE